MPPYFKVLLRPLAMLLIAASLMHFQLASNNFLIAALIPFIQLFASSWAGWLLVTEQKVNVWAASFSGALLLFIDIFFFGYLPLLVLGNLPSLAEVPSNKLILGSPETTSLAGFLVLFVLMFPFNLAASGVGAYIGHRKLKASLLPPDNT